MELTCAITIIAGCILALLSSVLTAEHLQHDASYRAIANEALRRAIERIRSVPFGEIYQRYNESAADDPLVGASPGALFAVDELESRSEDAVGRIFFPERDDALHEDFDDTLLGMAGGRDLDGDGVISDQPLATYVILPIRIVVTWRGISGPMSASCNVLLTER